MESKDKKSYIQIANEILHELIEKDIGKDAKLLSWDSNYFMGKGENFLGKVKGVHCTILYKGNQSEVFYVVKLNPRRSLELFQKMTHSFFVKEGNYLTVVSQIFNNILRSANFPPLNIPECLYVSFTHNEEIILLKDLRELNYKMFDKRLPLDIDHLLLMAKELAKQHAASYVYGIQKGKKDLNDLFPYMKDLWLDENVEGSSQYITYWKMRISSCIHALEELEIYPEALKYLKKNVDMAFNDFAHQWTYADSKFKVVCHADCWTNNMLFKYDYTEKPNEVMLLDFQQCKIASLVTDLHVLLMTSTSAQIRRKYNEEILSCYYRNFSAICKGSGRYVPFTLAEMKKEFLNKADFAFYAGISRLPLLIHEPENLPDFNIMNAQTFLNFIKTEETSLKDLLSTNELIRERIFDVIETSSEYGLFKGV